MIKTTGSYDTRYDRISYYSKLTAHNWQKCTFPTCHCHRMNMLETVVVYTWNIEGLYNSFEYEWGGNLVKNLYSVITVSLKFEYE